MSKVIDSLRSFLRTDKGRERLLNLAAEIDSEDQQAQKRRNAAREYQRLQQEREELRQEYLETERELEAWKKELRAHEARKAPIGRRRSEYSRRMADWSLRWEQARQALQETAPPEVAALREELNTLKRGVADRFPLPIITAREQYMNDNTALAKQSEVQQQRAEYLAKLKAIESRVEAAVFEESPLDTLAVIALDLKELK